MPTQAEIDRTMDFVIHGVALILFIFFPLAILIGGLWFVCGALILSAIVAVAAVEANMRVDGFSAWVDSAPKLWGVSLLGWFQLIVAWIGGGFGLIVKWLIGG